MIRPPAALGALVVATAASACFNPSVSRCNNRDGCLEPDGGAETVDAAIPDAGSPVPDGSDAALPVCYGGSGVWQVCLPAAPTQQVPLTSAIDTDDDDACLAVSPIGWEPAQSPSCFIVGDVITVTGAISVTGSRPLVLLAASQLTIAAGARLDVAGHVGNSAPVPGVRQDRCDSAADPHGPPAGGGGAGGTFRTRGGDGGAGSREANGGGIARSVDAAPPAVLRGGCPGQRGGGGAAPGPGGGAVYLVSGKDLILRGTVNASGGGGGIGNRTGHGGGSGGGSGGMIVLFSPEPYTTDAGAVLVANGGSGGGGGGISVNDGSDTNGERGNDPVFSPPLEARRGGIGGGNAGDGGWGYPAVLDDASKFKMDATGDIGDPNEGGGGGGGGGGYIRANKPVSPITASPQVETMP